MGSGAPYHRWRFTRFDGWLLAAGFVLCFTFGAVFIYRAALYDILRRTPLSAFEIAAALLFVLGSTIPFRRFVRSTWHALANRVAVRDPEALGRPYVVDGDTIDDLATGVRYRLANIDAPETGDNAKCYNERVRGELAKRAAIRAVSSAGAVTVRRTFRKDRYGRTVAFVYVDGRDLGEALVAAGLAAPWRGRRKRWCGAAGQLRELSAVRGELFSCKTCESWKQRTRLFAS